MEFKKFELNFTNIYGMINFNFINFSNILNAL